MLSEAKTPKVIMYHGTAARNLRSIMSHGLMPQPRKRAWEEDPDASFHGASRVSLDGIYLTQNLMTAMSAATNGSNRQYMKEGEIIVAVEMQPKTAFADEDDLNFMTNISGMEMKVADLYYCLEKGVNMDHVEEWRQKYRDNFFSMIEYKIKLHPKAKERLTPMVDEVFAAAVRRQAAYAEYYLKNYFRDVKAPDKSEAERAFMTAREKLTRTLKALAS